MIFHCVCRGLQAKMLEWKEKENKAKEMDSLHELVAVEALRDYGLFKYFKTKV